MKYDFFNKKYGAIILIILVCSIIFMFSVKSFIEKSNNFELETINQAKVKTSLAMKYIQGSFKILDYPDVKRKLKEYSAEINSKINVVDLQGIILYTSGNENKVSTKVNLTEFMFNDNNYTKSHPGFYRISFPILVKGVQKGNAVFEIPLSGDLSGRLRSEISTIVGVSSFCLLILLAVIAFLLLKIRRKYQIPLKLLENASEEISKGHFNVSVKSSATEELGPLIINFNKMKDDLAYLFDKQAEYEASRKELLATISHELRTPISAIKMYAEGLKSGLAEDFETFGQYIDVIHSKADSLNKLIDDLFLHSQQELSQLKINKVEIYSHKLFAQIVEPLKIQFASDTVRFESKIDIPDVLLSVDVRRIEQVILNLVQNARKHVKNDGLIIFEVSQEADFIKISVSDNGTGIRPEDMPFIFERFYQGKDSKTGDYQGAGLGLSICKYIVEAHGGKITVETALKTGSRFTLTIPKG